MFEKLSENEKRKYVHFTLHPEEILYIVEQAEILGMSQSQFVSWMVRRTMELGPLHNPGPSVKPAA